MFIHGKIQLKNNYASQLAIHYPDIAILCMTWVVKGHNYMQYDTIMYVSDIYTVKVRK